MEFHGRYYSPNTASLRQYDTIIQCTTTINNDGVIIILLLAKNLIVHGARMLCYYGRKIFIQKTAFGVVPRTALKLNDNIEARSAL